MKALLAYLFLINWVYSVKRSHYFNVYYSRIPDATPQWLKQCKGIVLDELNKHGANITDYKNFTFSVGHALHFLDIQAVEIFFGIKLPAKNGIPTNNPDQLMREHHGKALDDLPSHEPKLPTPPSPSPGYRNFVKVLDNFIKWKPFYPYNDSNILNALNHQFHMLDVWAKTRNLADEFTKVPADICTCTMDFKGYGLREMMEVFFDSLAAFINAQTLEESGFPPIDLNNITTWDQWRNHSLDDLITFYPAGLFWKCQMEKYSPCCKHKTVGSIEYRRVGAGKCVSDCMYERNDQPGSMYYFTEGNDKSTCHKP